MQLKKISLSSKTPRDLSALKADVDLKKYLKPYYIMGIYFLGALVLLTLMVGFYDPSWLLGVMFVDAVIFLFAYFLFINPARTRLRNRESAFLNGELMTATVTKKSRVFVAWKSWRDYALDAEFMLADGNKKSGRLKTPKREVADSFAEGDSIQVLYDKNTGMLLFPAELGLEIEIAGVESDR